MIATDVWASMGQEAMQAERRVVLESVPPGPGQAGPGRPGCLVLHCLPAHRGEEITADVLDGPNSVVWEQAENRLHAQKALIAWLLEQTR